MQCKVVINFITVNTTQVCYQSNESNKAVLLSGAVFMLYKVVQLLIVYLPPLLLRVRISSTGCKVFGVPGSSSVGVPGSSTPTIEKQGYQTAHQPCKKKSFLFSLGSN